MKSTSRSFKALAIAILPIFASAQTNTFPSSGSVGIGTTSPGELLSVSGTNVKPIIGGNTSHTALYSTYNSQDNTALEINGSAGVNNGSAWLVLSNSGSTSVGSNPGLIAFVLPTTSGSEKRVAEIGTIVTANSSSTVTGCLTFNTTNGGTYTEKMRVTADGLIGINVDEPEAVLHVVKNSVGGSGGTLFLDNKASSAVGNATEIAFSNDIGGSYAGVSGSRIKSITQNALSGAADLTFTTWNGTVEAEKMRVTNSGNVGIGTTSPSYKLTVSGTVRASQFISDTTTYADFVFKPEYQLPSLEEVEKCIQQNGHLPGVPSEADARRDGIDVVALQVTLLQKIEELTLHAIEHQKQITALKAENRTLRTQIAELTP